MPLELSVEDLPEISRTASIPRYPRGSLKGGIVHFGVGNFHRAHQAVYLDACSTSGSTMTGRSIGAGVREANMRHAQKTAQRRTT
jgi:mannitol 2-dehydrogenase